MLGGALYMIIKLQTVVDDYFAWWILQNSYIWIEHEVIFPH